MEKKVGIITFPIGDGNLIPLNNISIIIQSLSNDTYLITGNAGGKVVVSDKFKKVTLINHQSGGCPISQLFHYIKTQLLISLELLKSNKYVDFWIYPIGGEALLLSIIFAKILQKPVIMSLTSSTELMMTYQGGLLNSIVIYIVKLNYFLSDKIILYSPNLISEWKLEPYHRKISIAGEHFLDFTTFTITTPFLDRPNLIGYIGRLSEEKGIQQFTAALPTLLNQLIDFHAFIGGDGQLKEFIESSIIEHNLTNRVDLPGWISHNDLPRHLNKLLLLVIPSYTEGLPNIMLEAMACCTPVLATPVGTIPTVIVDGKTGFIMENNSPECITRNVARALACPDLEEIGKNGRRFVEEHYSFEKVVERWGEILLDIK